MLILRTKNRSNNSVVYFSWLIWSPDNITFLTSWWLSRHCREEGYLQKYLKASTVFPKARHGSIPVDLFFSGNAPTPGFSRSRVCCDWSSLSVKVMTCTSCTISLLSGTGFYCMNCCMGCINSESETSKPLTWKTGWSRVVLKQERMSEKGLI